MKSLLYLTLIITIKILLCSAFAINICPHTFYYCSQQGTSCSIPSSYTSGVMSYGVKKVYNLIPFTKISGSSMTLRCDDNNGNIIPGFAKYCCYKSTASLYPTSNWQGSKSEGSSQYFLFTHTTSQRYGANDQYVYRPVTNAKGWCNNGYYNNPVPGTTKHCNYNNDLPDTLQGQSWTECGPNNNGYCTGLIQHRSTWVRYQQGTSRYYYRLVYCMENVPFDGMCKIPCNHYFFGDPDESYSTVLSKCWRSNEFIISDEPSQISTPQQPDEPNSFIPLKFIPLQVDIGFVVIGLLVLVNITCSIYCFCQKRRRIKNKYQSGKLVDSESDVEEPKDINIVQ